MRTTASPSLRRSQVEGARTLLVHRSQCHPGHIDQRGHHRLLPRAASTLQGRCTLDVPEGRSHVYLRARQRNGHIAWASPVFLNYR